jgi:putative membrane protein
MKSVIQGVILGFIIVLPGMSGGTAFLVMGMYEQLIKDLGRLNLLPYVPLLLGMIAGIFMSGMVFALVFQTYRDITVAFLLGCILASLRSVLQDVPAPNRKRLAFVAGGLLLGILVAGEPLAVVSDGTLTSPILLVIGGALSTAAMVIPGVPGSSVLIVLGMYDSMLLYIRELVFGQLFIFAIGCVLGLILLVKLLEQLYSHYRDLLAYFFAGLIVGSGRALIPHHFSLGIVAVFLIGFVAVWYYSGRRVSPSQESNVIN